MHHSSQVTVPCDFKSFKKQADLSCSGTSNHKAVEETHEENTWAVGTAANTDSPLNNTRRAWLVALQVSRTCILQKDSSGLFTTTTEDVRIVLLTRLASALLP